MLGGLQGLLMGLLLPVVRSGAEGRRTKHGGDTPKYFKKRPCDKRAQF